MQTIKKISAFLMIGLLIIGVAIFSSELGLTPNWGKGRIAVLFLGLLITLIPWIAGKKSEPIEGNLQSDLFAFPALLLVIVIYIWFISISRDATSNYYDLLGTSFRQGQLSLSLRPDAALLELPDPYDPSAREGIKAPLDLALYDGKFYLYWGPAPALLVAIVKPLFPEQISDNYLLFVFLCGIFLSQFLLILRIWERFFSEIPKWIVVLSIFVAGLINPTLWLLSQPKIYEAAIAGGQFFFIMGLLSAFTAIDRPTPSTWRLGLAGIFWSLAVGTRSVLVFPVAFMTLMVLYWFYRIDKRSWIELVTGLISLGIPLIVGAMVFGWYNWARFGSIFETGFSYALAGPHLQAHLGELFSPAYIFQNLYNYLLNPFAVSPASPFLHPLRGRIDAVLPGQIMPEIYSAQAITGLICAAPFTVFAAISVAALFKRNHADDSDEDPKMISLDWILISLLGSFMLSFVSLLAFFWTAMRYAEDFMPALTLLSILGFWYVYRSLSREPKRINRFVVIGATLAGLSLIVGILLALSNYRTSGLL